MKNRYPEIIVGSFILIIAIFFIVYFFNTVVFQHSNTYKVKVDFRNIGPLSIGSKVNINGVNVGSVTDIYLDGPNYNAVVILSLDGNIQIPIDSSVSIKSSGLLDSPSINILPSNSKTYVKNGEILKNSKDWESLEDKIGNIFFNINK